mmetsp:Transcript_99947/g.172432  ORF Transcript_99947/g.172432 Transcript_99947/m.172432 type:complete len:137 (-) Transcript_99947:125-535(-)
MVKLRVSHLMPSVHCPRMEQTQHQMHCSLIQLISTVDWGIIFFCLCAPLSDCFFPSYYRSPLPSPAPTSSLASSLTAPILSTKSSALQMFITLGMDLVHAGLSLRFPYPVYPPQPPKPPLPCKGKKFKIVTPQPQG